MPPRAGKNVFVVVTSTGVDSVYATDTGASDRAETLKESSGASGVRVELHKLKEDVVKHEPKSPAPKASAARKKTKSAEEQRAANAEKPFKSSDADLPDNMKALLAGTGDILSGKSIVVTGVPPTLQRKNAEKLVITYGGKLLKSVSKNTDFVVMGNDAGPKKLEQIEGLGIETLDEDAFIEMLEAAGASGVKRGADGDTKPAKAKRQKK